MDRVLVVIVLFIFQFTYAQTENSVGPIITDRPDASNTSFLIPKGYFQVESGSQLDGNKYSPDNCQLIYTYDNTSFKFSPSHLVELKLISGYCKQANNKKTYWDKSPNEVNGFTPLVIGSKVLLIEQKALFPHLSLETNFVLPGNRTLGAPTFVCPEIRLLMFNHLTKHLSLSYNLGIDYFNSSKLANPRYLYTLSLGIALLNKLGAFVESYGYFQSSTRADYRIDGGLTYHIFNQLQADLAGGYGLSSVSPNFFLTTGLSWRFKAL
jgi:hypothetical protein